MNSALTLLRRFDLSLMNDKFISALNKSSERYNKTKKNYPQSLDWFKNYVIANLIMSFGRTKELEINDGTYYDIHQYLKKHYSDEIEERWDELQEFDIRESIRKVLREESKKKTQEMKEGELTERCWAGYTQKGMKTMFGKRYPNCVKKKKG